MNLRILVPVDGSALSEVSLEYAAYVAELRQGQLLLLRSGPEAGYREYLENHAEKLRQRGLQVSVSEDQQRAEEAILALSDQVDLVVMSSHGEGGLGRWLMGSTTTRVVQACSKPVLVVGGQALERVEFRPFRRLMVPLDGSEICMAAVAPAVAMARAARAELLLFRSLVTSDLDHALPSVAAAHAAEEAMASEYLEGVRTGIEGVETRLLMHAATPTRGIVAVAESEEIDLIVMTTHGRSGFVRWICGSVTEAVLYQAPCPVLVVNPRYAPKVT
ncbi:MAG: universal stress protein [Vulcanimicrobiota bacterium]